MLSKEELILLHHYLKEGLTKTTVATRLGISRRTVHRYVTNGKPEPQYGPRESRASKLDPFQKYLRGRVLGLPRFVGGQVAPGTAKAGLHRRVHHPEGLPADAAAQTTTSHRAAI
jgi:predicted site-specific integrase-resolvase